MPIGFPSASPQITRRLAFNLEADEEKEEDHQPVVDPEMQLIRELLTCETEGQFGMPETEVALCPRRIGPDKSGHGAGDKQNPARSGLAFTIRAIECYLSLLSVASEKNLASATGRRIVRPSGRSTAW